MRNKEPIFYSFMREMFDKHADVGIKTISYKKARWVLSRYRIPHCVRMLIINEMIGIGMLQRINQRELEIKWQQYPNKIHLLLTNLK